MPDNRYSCVVDRDRHKQGERREGKERSYLHARRRGSSGLSALITVQRRITTRVERRTSEREREENDDCLDTHI